MRKPCGFAVLLLSLSAMASTLDPCSLISSQSLERSQNAKFYAAQPHSHDAGSFTASQCFFKLLPESSSVSLQLLTRSVKDRLNPREFWRHKFHPTKPEEAADKGDEAEAQGSKHQKPPQHIAGIGDDAFWVDTGRGGALYVLIGDQILRLSLGGKATQAEKTQRATLLAKEAIEKLLPPSVPKSK